MKIYALLPIWKKAGAHTHEKARIAVQWQGTRPVDFNLAGFLSERDGCAALD